MAFPESPVLMFLALCAVYSPVASVSSYFPVMSGLSVEDRKRLAAGLFAHVSVFAMVALWVGGPLLKLLGITTAALTVTGGIALMYAALPLMRGVPAEAPRAQSSSEVKAVAAPGGGRRWQRVLFMPVTFPLTVGGTTFAIFVSFRSSATNLGEVVALSAAGLAFAAVTALTLYVSGHVERRVSPNARNLLERLSGIVLTAIAVTLLAKGAPRMVIESLERLNAP